MSLKSCSSAAIRRARWPITWFSARLVLARVWPPRHSGWVTMQLPAAGAEQLVGRHGCAAGAYCDRLRANDGGVLVVAAIGRQADLRPPAGQCLRHVLVHRAQLGAGGLQRRVVGIGGGQRLAQRPRLRPCGTAGRNSGEEADGETVSAGTCFDPHLLPGARGRRTAHARVVRIRPRQRREQPPSATAGAGSPRFRCAPASIPVA